MELIRHHFQIIDSTNTWAKQNAHLLPLDKITLVTANEQTAGRGRFKRRWESPPGQNVLATFCFFIKKHRADVGNIPQVLAVSTAKALEMMGFNPQLKWPNDILLSQKKVGGILAETTALFDQLCFIIGIGLNVNMPTEKLREIDRPATSLLAEDHAERRTEEVLHILQMHFIADLHVFLEEGFVPFLEQYRSRIASVQGESLHFDDNRAVWEGTFHSINNDGSLNLLLKTGEIKTFIAGEIVWPARGTVDTS